MSLQLETRIKNARLTKTEQMAADYFLNHRESLYFMTAKDIARALGISDTSVIRLCRTLGYRGFQELQEQLRQELSQQLAREKYVVPCRQIPEDGRSAPDAGYVRDLELAVQALQGTYLKNGPDKIRQTADLLLKSDRIFVGGFRGASAAACYLGVLLAQYTGRVEYAARADSGCVETVLDYGEDDCVVLVGTERYSGMACVLADMARENRRRLVAIVDKATSPLAYHADVVLTCDTQGSTPFHSYLGIFFLIEALSAELSRCCGVYTRERLERLDRYLTKLELY